MASRLETTRSLDYQPPTPLCSQQCFYTFCFVFLCGGPVTAPLLNLSQNLSQGPRRQDLIYMPGAPLMVPYKQFCTCSMGPALRYQIHMLTSPYLLFRNRLIGNEGSYWLLQILWLGTITFEINYRSRFLSSTL